LKLIIFSDIHGNIYSLKKALQEMKKYNPDQYLFLGDMAGYYYNQNECIELLSSLNNLTSLRGNHDDNFLKALDDDLLLKSLVKKYGKSYQLLKENITDKSLKYLQSMKDYEKNNIYEAYHGSPNNYYNEYIYPDNKDFKIGIGVLEEIKKRKVGTRLLETALTKAKQRGITRVKASINKKNIASHNFFKKNKFSRISESKEKIVYEKAL